MGLLAAAGLITGEALIGIRLAIPIAATKNADVLAVPANMQPGQWAGLAALGLIGWWMYNVSTNRLSTEESCQGDCHLRGPPRRGLSPPDVRSHE